ncbi:DNRLRE domain-containing protein [Streptomyces sp. NPDC004435]|uniref:DNRLRE domain-containing protein n=1 Tax=Streptomyces sp. NPDC004435 TaxID=3364701 RepID=UPI0036C9FB26
MAQALMAPGWAGATDPASPAGSSADATVPGLEPTGPPEAADENAARLLARLQQRRTEVLGERSEDASVFVNPDGSTTVEAYTGPVRIKNADGQWEDVNTDLIDTGANLTPVAAPAQVQISDGGSGVLASVKDGKHLFGLKWGQALPAPDINGDTATYALGPGQLMTVQALPQGFEQSVVLTERPDEKLEYRFPLAMTGLKLSQAENRHLVLESLSGEVIAEASAPMMWDSSIDPASGDPAHRAEIETRLETAADGSAVLVLAPDPSFLASPDVTYPLILDPIATLAASTDTWVATNYPDSQRGSTELKAGTYDAGTTVARSYLKFDVSRFAGKHITDTNLALYSYYSSTCSTSGSGVQVRRITSDWDPSAITWGAQPATTSTGSVTNKAALGYGASCPAGVMAFDTDAIVQAWADGAANYGFQVRGANEGDSLTWRRFRSANYTADADSATEPHLTVTYNTPPPVPTMVSPAPGDATSDTTPALSVKITDADGGNASGKVVGDVQIWTASGTAPLQSGNTGWIANGTAGSWSPPAALPAGTYKWRARSGDSTDNSPWSAFRTIVIDSTAPAAPTVTSTSHPAQSAWYASKDFTGSATAADTSGIEGYAVIVDRSATTTPATTITQTGTAVSKTGLADGTWYVHTRAKDNAGLWSAATHFAVRVDTTAPGTPLAVASSTHPLGTSVYASKNASFSWTAPSDTSGAAGYAVVVDQSAATVPPTTSTYVTTTTYSATVAGNGTWYLHLRARDKAGNWGTSAAHFKFAVDTTLPPTPTITSSSHADQSNAYANGSFTANWTAPAADTAGFSLTVDSSAGTTPDTTVDTTGTSHAVTMSDGTWYLHLRAVDNAGNWGAPTHFRFTVDTTAPMAPQVGSADFPQDTWVDGPGNAGTFTIAPSGSDVSVVRYRIDDEIGNEGDEERTLGTDGSPTTLTYIPVGDGEHTLTVTSVDGAGNVSAERSWRFFVGSAEIISLSDADVVSGAVELAAVAPVDATAVTFRYRAGSVGDWTTVPASDVADSNGAPVTWPQSMAEGMSDKLTWNIAAGTQDGPLEIAAEFVGTGALPGSRSTTITLDRAAVQPPEVDAPLDDFIQNEGADRLDRQRTLDDFRAWINDLPDVEANGFVGTVHDADALSVVLLWHGDSAQRTHIAQEAATRGITLTVEQRNHDAAQLDGAMDAAFAQAEAGTWAGFQIAYIAGVTPDFDGIEVHGAYTNTVAEPATSEPAEGGTGESGAETGAPPLSPGEINGVPVKIIPDTEAETAATRSSDYAPFNAGGLMYSPKWDTYCSTGFSIKISGRAYVTTARHCYAQDYRAAKGRAAYGTGVRNAGGGSRVLSAKGSALMFDGAWNNRSGYNKRVVGYDDLGIGDKVCTSGANTGVHCNIKVDKMRVRFDDRMGMGTFDTIHGTQLSSNQIAVRQGDSGGPVLTLAGDGKVYAAGMIQGVDKFVGSCGPSAINRGMCGKGVLFSSMRTVVRSISGASLVTW